MKSRKLIRITLAVLMSYLFMSHIQSSSAQVPGMINYQGRVVANGTNFDGMGQFKFALVTGTGSLTYWSNGVATVALPVTKGLYSVLLGDATISNMAPIPADVFANPDVRLRVWFDGGSGLQQFSPDQRIASVGYALNAQTARGVSTGGITSSMIATGAVGAAQLATGAVTAVSIAAQAVSAVALADGAVTPAKMLQVPDIGARIIITNPVPLENQGFARAIAKVGASRIAVGAAGATQTGSVYLYDMNGTYLSVITNPAPGEGDTFGSSIIAVGSDRMVVGNPESDVGTTNAGCAYLYDLSGVRLATITNPTPVFNGFFGRIMGAVGSNRFVVGVNSVGLAYLYDGNGALLRTITNPTPDPYDYFGSSVSAIGTNWFAVGADSDSIVAQYAGAVYLYDLNGALVSILTNISAVKNESFGAAIVPVGTSRFVVTANNSSRGALHAGCAYLYDLSGTQLAVITNPAPVDWVRFGSCVAAVGAGYFAIGDNSYYAGASNAGCVYYFDSNGTLVTTMTKRVPETNDRFGNPVAGLGSSGIAVGAYGESAAGLSGVGSVYLYGQHIGGVIAEGVQPGAVFSGDGAGLTGLDATHVTTGVLNSAVLDPKLQLLALSDGSGLTNLQVTGSVGAGLVDNNTLFISSSAPAGGDGSMARPWNSLYALTNNTGGKLNGKTVTLLAGVYKTGADIVFSSSYSGLTVKGWDPQNVRIISTNNAFRIFTCNAGATNIVLDSLTMTSTNTGGNGGAVYLRSGCTVQNCTFINCNSATNGGGAYCYYGGTIQNCVFINNTATVIGGGGVHCDHGGVVQNCSLTGNFAPGGGGILCYYGGTILNCVFAANTVSGSGGAVYCDNGGLIVNSDIIRGSGSTNSVASSGAGAKWRSVWTSDASSAGFVIYSTNLWN